MKAALIALLQDSSQPLPPWLLVVIAIVLIVLFIWLLLRWQASVVDEPVVRRAQTEAPANARAESVLPVTASPVVQEAPAVPVEPTVVVADDLEIIEGIGPKIAGLLKAAGVVTFIQLSEMTPEKINQLLQAGGIKLADPRTWPEQSRLAASGDMKGLAELQKRLTAGRNK